MAWVIFPDWRTCKFVFRLSVHSTNALQLLCVCYTSVGLPLSFFFLSVLRKEVNCDTCKLRHLDFMSRRLFYFASGLSIPCFFYQKSQCGCCFITDSWYFFLLFVFYPAPLFSKLKTGFEVLKSCITIRENWKKSIAFHVHAHESGTQIVSFLPLQVPGSQSVYRENFWCFL